MCNLKIIIIYINLFCEVLQIKGQIENNKICIALKLIFFIENIYFCFVFKGLTNVLPPINRSLNCIVFSQSVKHVCAEQNFCIDLFYFIFAKELLTSILHLLLFHIFL